MPTATITGSSHAAIPQNITSSPLTSPRMSSTIGVESMPTMWVPATTTSADSPMRIQYGGPMSRGPTGRVISRIITRTAVQR